MTKDNIQELLNLIEDKLDNLNKQLYFLSNEQSFKGYTHYETDKQQTITDIENLKKLRIILLNFQKIFKEGLVKSE